MILSDLSFEELTDQAARREHPKWWSLCVFKLLQLPTLDACYIDQSSSNTYLSDAALKFSEKIGASSLLVRSDGGSEASKYVRGGLTLPLSDAIRVATIYKELGRSIILLEPTNRFANLLSINITVAQDLAWTAEALGCGFDTSDLQRGFVIPQWMWSGSSLLSATPREAEIVSAADHSARTAQRIYSIYDLLKREKGWNNPAEAASFLVESGNTCLFNESAAGVRPPRSRLLTVIRAARTLTQNLAAQALPFTLAYATLWDKRGIFWDITPGRTKWARQANHVSPQSAIA